MSRTSIRGTILASEGDDEWVCADVVARSDGGSPHRYALRGSFEIQAEDGARYRVIPTEAELKGGRKESKRGTWASLSGTPFARLAEGFNAGPHVRVEIEVRGFRVGDSVSIDGEVRDAPRTEPADYRGHAPGRPVPAVVEARRIQDTKVSRAPEPPPRARPARVSLGAAAASVFSVALVMLVSWDPPASLAGAALRFGWLSFALVLAWRAAGIGFGQPQLGSVGDLSEYVPAFVTLDTRAQRRTLYGVTSFPGTMTVVFIFLSLPWGLFSTFLRELTGEPEAQPHAAAILAAVVSLLASLGLLIDAHRRSRRNARTVRALLSAPPRRGTEPGWRSIRGTIASGSSWSHVFDVKDEEVGRSVNLHLHERSTAPERIMVMTDTGEPLEVCPTGAAWGTARLSWTATEGRASRIVLSPDAAARAIVVGQFEPDSSGLEAHGPETLILYTSGGTGDPRRALEARLWLQRAGWLLPLVAAAVVYVRWALG